MNNKAKALSDRSYYTEVRYIPEGNGSPDYIAEHPEIAQCIAQGDTPEEALQNLASVRAEIIEYLVENDLPVPDPAPMRGAVVSTPAADKSLRILTGYATLGPQFVTV